MLEIATLGNLIPKSVREYFGDKRTVAFEPARGEEQARLERECEEAFKDPNNFHKVINSIILLIGGDYEKRDGRRGRKASIRDEQNKINISLEQIEIDPRSDSPKIPSIITSVIITEKGQIPKGILAITDLLNGACNSFMPLFGYLAFDPNSDSLTNIGARQYMDIDPDTRKRAEEMQLKWWDGKLKAGETKDFLQRVFDVYKRQGQGVQTTTSQS